MKHQSANKTLSISNKPFHSTMWIIIVILLLQWSLAAVFFTSLPPEIPLFFSLPYGTNQLAHKLWFFVLPSISLLSIIINYLLLKIGANINQVVNQIITLTTGLVIFLAFIAQIYVIILVL